MSSIVIALPKIEDARKIRSVLERHGLAVASVCSTASNALSSASELGNGVLICGHRLPDMNYLDLAECMPNSVFIVHLHGHCFFYCDRCGTCIFQTYCSCDHIKLWKYTIKKMSTQSAGMVFQNDFQSFCLIFLCKHCRKSFETVFSF